MNQFFTGALIARQRGLRASGDRPSTPYLSYENPYPVAGFPGFTHRLGAPGYSPFTFVVVQRAMHQTDWKSLLADPGPDGHIVQLYQDADFYGEAISYFAAEGLAKGESIIIVATQPNWLNISGRLTGKGFDLEELFDRGQLTLLDANETLPKFMAGSTPDGKRFKPLARNTIEKARQGGKFPRVRWWGEMVNVLYVDGQRNASHRLEQFFDEVAHEETIAIFCSFLMDKYDPLIYDEAFGNVCSTHSNVIPTDDYFGHRQAVNRAIEDVVGPLKGEALRSLVSWQRRGAGTMPSSQSMLLWLKEAMPRRFPEVLALAKQYDAAVSTAQHLA